LTRASILFYIFPFSFSFSSPVHLSRCGRACWVDVAGAPLGPPLRRTTPPRCYLTSSCPEVPREPAIDDARIWPCRRAVSNEIPPVCCRGHVVAGQGGKICGRGRSATCSSRARRCDLRPERRTELQFRPGHAGGELQFRPSRSGRIELRSGHVRRAPASNQLPSHSIQLSNQSRLQLHVTPLICRLIALFFGRIC
jgi:hypothetical protein